MKTRSLVIMAMLTAILFAGQVCMAAFPNIEIVTLLVILYTQVYRKRVFFIIYAFALLEGVFTALASGGSTICTSGASWL